ncbi:hypothetical protein [Comamonas suwonensis]|uniref:hypothetical protein n=1 Tax=Comamonas suwonensis TaxID=2606214 RepID=UPI00145CC0C9|nr:hypothetical protein [Comamonas suwonensis]MBI1624938.1 hypothetical protein [Comamonas suwonensis]
MKIKYAPIALSMLTSLAFGQSVDCQKQQQNQTVFNMCKVTVGPTASPNVVVGPSSTMKTIDSNTVSGVTGQVGNATVVGPESIQAQQNSKIHALILAVKAAPVQSTSVTIGPVANTSSVVIGPIVNTPSVTIGPVENKPSVIIGPVANTSSVVIGPVGNTSPVIIGPVVMRNVE